MVESRTILFCILKLFKTRVLISASNIDLNSSAVFASDPFKTAILVVVVICTCRPFDCSLRFWGFFFFVFFFPFFFFFFFFFCPFT